MDNNKPLIPGTPSAQQPRPRVKPGTFWLIAGMLVLLTLLLFSRGNGNRSEVTYDFFWKQLQADNISEVTFDNQSLLLGRFKKVPEAPPSLPVRPKTHAGITGSASPSASRCNKTSASFCRRWKIVN